MINNIPPKIAKITTIQVNRLIPKTGFVKMMIPKSIDIIPASI